MFLLSNRYKPYLLLFFASLFNCLMVSKYACSTGERVRNSYLRYSLSAFDIANVAIAVDIASVLAK